MKFKKKPLVIDATQWFKDGDHPAVKIWDRGGHVYPNGMALINTLGDEMTVRPGDWIIDGVNGYRLCRPDTFAATYELAEWSSVAPTEQAWYWHWNGDEESRPVPTSVLYSGSAQKCFVSIGQLGITDAIMCDEYGGYWMRMTEPGTYDVSIIQLVQRKNEISPPAKAENEN